MKNFISSIFSSCLGTILALFLIIFILGAIGSGMVLKNKSEVHISDNSVLKLEIPAQLPEQTNNSDLDFSKFSFDNGVIGLHDLAKTIKHAATDSKIKGIYLKGSSFNHGYATLKVIRDALQEFKSNGKFVICYTNFLDHKNYYIASASDKIYLHPLGYIDLKGFGIAIPYFKEFLDKIGLDFNVYYAGEFKSATEPFRFNKMSPQNRLQLKEYIDSQYHLYIDEVSESRHIPYETLKADFDQFASHSPERALSNKLVDSIGYEDDAFASIQHSLSLPENDKINFVRMEDYYEKVKELNENYSSSNRIAVLFAEGDITEGSGKEGEIGRKYLKILRDIKTTKSIKGLVLRINSPGGSALLSDEILKEVDLIKAQGKPVVVSMGEYAASGGYYIACHADSIFASPYTLTGSIGVFALIPNFNKLTGDKIGIDVDTVGTGPMANKFNVMLPWGKDESDIFQENIEHTYDRFISVISTGRNLDKEKVKEIAKGRIWTGQKAIEIGLVNKTGTLQDAISCAARMASVDKYRTSEFPSQKDPLQKLFDMMQGNKEDQSSRIQEMYLKSELGSYYNWYKQVQFYRNNQGLQMRLIMDCRI
jgi:protease-4